MNTALSFITPVLERFNKFAAADVREDCHNGREPTCNEVHTVDEDENKTLSLTNQRDALVTNEQSNESNSENDQFQSSERPKSNFDSKMVDEQIRNDSFCSACQSILGSPQMFSKVGIVDVQDFHETYSSLNDAMRAGCYICMLIEQKLELKFLVEDPDTGSNNDDWKTNFPRLRYNIRQTPSGFLLRFYFTGIDGTIYSLLTLYMHPLSHIDGILHPVHIENCSESTRNMELLRYWLHQCQSKHTKCSLIGTGFDRKLPTRLIEIERVRGQYVIRLCNGNTLPKSARYVTLSHCWGQQPILTLTESNLESFYQNIDISRLSKTFQDALLTTHCFHFTYLWIDSLCIIQDSRNDWLKEAPQMGEVYRNAELNLAATGFKDGRKGIFSTRNPRLLLPQKVYANWDGTFANNETQLRGQYYLLDEELWKDGLSNAPLNRRAWVVQERILSSRIIHFGAQQLFWECSELKASEAFPNGFRYLVDTGENLKNNFFKNRLSLSSPEINHSKQSNTTVSSQLNRNPPNHEELYRFWKTVVHAYSNGQLTFSQDKLPAISGIANDFGIILKDQYIAGLWKGDLLNSLLWRVDGPESFYGVTSAYRAPTWSWASVDAKISYDYALVISYSSKTSGHPHSESIHSCILDVTSAAAMSYNDQQLTSQWSLQIKGPLRRLIDTIPTRLHKNKLSLISWEVNVEKINLMVFQDFKPGFNKNTERQNVSLSTASLTRTPFVRVPQLSSLDPEVDEIFLLPIRSSFIISCVQMCGLMLCPTNRRPGEFYRIGFFVARDSDCQKVVLQHLEAHEEKFFERVDNAGNYTISIV